jgi:hypothetical protein
MTSSSMTPNAETVALLIEIGRYGCVRPQRRGKVRREMQRRWVTQLRDDVGPASLRSRVWPPSARTRRRPPLPVSSEGW